MPSATYAISLAIGGIAIQKTITRTGNHANAYEVTLPAGKAVTSWVKTDANTAACNLPSGHGYTNGKFDVYWSGGMRYGVDGTISTNALSLDGGAGDDFPASATTGIVATKQVSIATTIDGDNSEIVAIVAEYADQASTAKAHVDMQDSSATVVEIDLTANAPYVVDIEGGATNVFTGNVIEATKASNGSSSAAATLKIVALETV